VLAMTMISFLPMSLAPRIYDAAQYAAASRPMY